MYKIIIFYKYSDIQYPKQIQKWQKQICEQLNLKGRIILASEGINATLGGTEQNIEIYKNVMKEHDLFKDIDFKESNGDNDCFPRLRIVIRNEIVTLGLDPKSLSYKDAGKHLTPDQVHHLLQNKPNDLIILDGRNNYESAIGYFQDAILPEIKYFREFPSFVDKNLDLLKDKKILMYCTAGIRCERASAYINSKKIAKEVYQIQGGIHKYIEKYPDGFFKGKNYVFDARVSVKVNDEIIGNCFICKTKYDDYTNCLNAACNKHFISCSECLKKFNNTCSQNCYNLINQKKVNVRPQFKKIENTTCSL